MIILLAILLAGVFWWILGIIAHYSAYAKPNNDHDPLGYLLSIFPGPFIWWIIKYERW